MNHKSIAIIWQKNDFLTLTIFLGVWQGSEHASEMNKKN